MEELGGGDGETADSAAEMGGDSAAEMAEDSAAGKDGGDGGEGGGNGGGLGGGDGGGGLGGGDGGGDGGGGGEGGELQVYVFAVKKAPSAATQPLPGALRIKSSRMSVVEAMDLSTPYPSSTLTHGHALSAMTFAAVQQAKTSAAVGVAPAPHIPITT